MGFADEFDSPDLGVHPFRDPALTDEFEAPRPADHVPEFAVDSIRGG